jgi:hypothetical protein
MNLFIIPYSHFHHSIACEKEIIIVRHVTQLSLPIRLVCTKEVNQSVTVNFHFGDLNDLSRERVSKKVKEMIS